MSAGFLDMASTAPACPHYVALPCAAARSSAPTADTTASSTLPACPAATDRTAPPDRLRRNKDAPATAAPATAPSPDACLQCAAPPLHHASAPSNMAD